jgi:hypothetical protein
MMYAIDFEWSPDRKPLFGYMYGGKGTGAEILKLKDKYVDDLAVYFVSPMDKVFSYPHVRFREYLDLSVALNIHENISTYEKTNPFNRSLERRVRKYLGRDMPHKKINFSEQVNCTAHLRAHCREDARATYDLACFLEQMDPDALDRARCLEIRNRPWEDIARQHIVYDLEWQNALIDPPTLHRRLTEKGLDFFVLNNGKLGIKRNPFQKFLRDHNIPVDTTISPAPYAQDGVLYQMHWKQFENLGRSAFEPETRELCSLIHIALRCHTAQTGESRFNRHELYPLEICCAQSSGRVTHKACPITAGVIFRMGVIPPVGMKTVSLDVKSQEVVLAAHFSEDKGLQTACREDVYSYLWSVLMDTPYIKLEKTDANRKLAKEIVLPWLYGVGHVTLAWRLNVEPAFSRVIMDRLARAFPAFEEWKGAVLREAYTRGHVVTLLDRFPLKVKKDSNPRQAINHVVQGTSADLLRAWCAALVDAGYPPVATLHDGVYLYVPADLDKQELITLSQAALNTALPAFQSWIVEAEEFRGHLMEKGDDYWRVLAALTGKSAEDLKREEVTFIANRS